MLAIPEPSLQQGVENDTPRTVVVHSDLDALRASNDWMNLRESRQGAGPGHAGEANDDGTQSLSAAMGAPQLHVKLRDALSFNYTRHGSDSV